MRPHAWPRNRNKYADNGIDGSENPFWTTPMRSPLDNLTISVGLSYRFNKEGTENTVLLRGTTMV